jgi:hypothetical protein
MKALSWLTVIAIALGPIGGAAQEKRAEAPAKAAAQRTFATPEDAAKALIDAVRANDRQAVLDVVGAKARNWLMTADEIADREEGRLFVAAHDRKSAVVKRGDARAMLTVGDESWEFPAPIVRKAGKWSFDADAGREEILNRRVGRNELDTIQTLLAIVDAQREYAAADADGNGLRDYAARFASSRGKKDGLYWETGAGEPPSPLGPLVAQAVREGYGDKVKSGRVEPYQGYLYRMITSQGGHATGGAYDYVLDGRLFGGFAVLAYPAAYGNTGVKTFIVNHEGVVYEKDLGPATAGQAAKIRRFDPDKTWKKAS